MDKALDKIEIQKSLKRFNQNWSVVEDKKLRREFIFGDFSEAIGFVNKVANLAEAQKHHPDIYIFYNRVVVELWTHKVAGLSQKDFDLAAKIENL